MENLALKQVNENLKQQLNIKLNVKIHSQAIQCYLQNDDLSKTFKLPQIKICTNSQTKATYFKDKMIFQRLEFVKMISMTKLNINHPVEFGKIIIHSNKDKRIFEAKILWKFVFISRKKEIDLENSIVTKDKIDNSVNMIVFSNCIHLHNFSCLQTHHTSCLLFKDFKLIQYCINYPKDFVNKIYVYEIKSHLINNDLLIMIWDPSGLCILFDIMRLS